MSTQGNYRLSSTRGKSEQLHVCRIKRIHATGTELVAEVYPAQLEGIDAHKGFSDPLRYCRTYPQSASRAELVRQLKRNNVSSKDIAALLAFPAEMPPKIKKPRKNKQGA